MTGNNRPASGGFSRDMVVLAVFAFAILCIFLALCRVMIVKHAEYSHLAELQHLKTHVDVAQRGTVYDRNGEVIASSIESVTINVNPNDIAYAQSVTQAELVGQPTAQVAVAKLLYRYLGSTYDMGYEDYYEMVTRENTSYVIVQRKTDKDIADDLREALEAAHLEGVYYESDTTRIYPNGQVGCQVIGTVGLKIMDSEGNILTDEEVQAITDASQYSEVYRGTSGLELQYDSLLAGRNGLISEERSDTGIPVAGGSYVLQPAENGEDMMVSLDIKLQQRMEEALLHAVSQFSAYGGSATVMDAATGEIYGACSFVRHDDEETGEVTYDYDAGKIWSISDVYEPGSTFKAFTAASVLANSDTTVDTMFNVPARLEVYDAIITDSHEHGDEVLSLNDIIAESSNIGTVNASYSVTHQNLYDTYTAFQFGQAPGTDFPGVAAGLLEQPEEWDGVQAVNITFGQGLSVSGLQILRGFAAIQQGGVLRTPHFLTALPNNEELAAELLQPLQHSDTVEDGDVCSQVEGMLDSVVSYGTGTWAAVEGYRAVGKTGTAEVAGTSGAYTGDTIVSFCGWLAGTDCNLVCLVTVERPIEGTDGGSVCGPVFADIMSFAADRYHVRNISS